MADSIEFNTQELRNKSLEMADALQGLPDVAVVSYEGEGSRNRGNTRAYAIISDSERVGTFNLVAENNGDAWVNAIVVDPEFRRRGFAVAAYIGVISVLTARGDRLISDKSGINEGSWRVFKSLVRRGVAAQVPERYDKYGFPVFVSTKIPEH